jgi:hypothetical protein
MLVAIKDVESIMVASKPVLFHPDFNARNIFVNPSNPTQTTSVLDWQAAAIEPAFAYDVEKLNLGPKVDKGTSVLHPVVRQYIAAPCSGGLTDVLRMQAMLTNLSRGWRSFGLPGRSMYRPSQADERKLEERASSWTMRMYLTKLLDCQPDGLVSAERWEEFLPIYRKEYSQFMARASFLTTCEEEGESEVEAIESAQRLWPFDLR